MNIKTMEVMLTMVELSSRNDHINQIWTRMYLTLHQTFITLLLFFQSKQTVLCIQIKPLSTDFCYYIASQHTIKTGHPAAWVLLIFKSELIQKREMFFFPLLSSRMQNKSGPQAVAFDSYNLYTLSPFPRVQTHFILSHCRPEEPGRTGGKVLGYLEDKVRGWVL